MNCTFTCPHCKTTIEADSYQVGATGGCPACQQLVVVPPVSNPQQKTFEDYAADAICTSAKIGWKVTKVTAPIAGRIVAKVIGRAASPIVSFLDRFVAEMNAQEEIARRKSAEGIAWFWFILITIVTALTILVIILMVHSNDSSF